MSFRFGEGKSGDAAAQAMPFKKFESAEEIEEKKKKRQEEWEKVRRPDQPETAPEEVYDPRTLYEQLQANKQKADDEHEEKYRLSNQVKGLEDDEAAFLDFVSDRQVQLDNERKKEEREALDEYRKAVSSQVSGDGPKTAGESKSQKAAAATKASSKKSQLELLKGAVKRKGVEEKEEGDKKKQKMSDEAESSKTNGANGESAKTSVSSGNHSNSMTKSASQSSKPAASHTIRVAGVLPGLCQYTDSTSDSNSSSSDSEGLSDDTKVKYQVIMKKVSCEQHR